MERSVALRLARHLLDAFDRGAAAGTMAVYAERLARLEEGPAVAAVELLIDTSRRLPYVSEILDAYRASGGRLPDPGRNMSPRTEDLPDLTDAERAAAKALAERKIREVVAHLRPEDEVGSVGSDDARRTDG